MPEKKRQKATVFGAKNMKNALKLKKTEMSPPATKVKAGKTETAWKSQLCQKGKDKIGSIGVSEGSITGAKVTF